ncbi:hypothetical protein HPB50_026513 [Hyalomma asiaticum]|uniref:Uncharacterized protein n=1 Tax=Hyalomma asiaticum TaxID=266040 RepID=A0ACB7T397_HYAAI|nr:hypothetical protein HPB50_026513 [Hyalomma asiaticum]
MYNTLKEGPTTFTTSGFSGNEASWSTTGTTSVDTLTESATTTVTLLAGAQPSFTELDSRAAVTHGLREEAVDQHQVRVETSNRLVSDYATPAFEAKVADVASRGVSHLGILNMLNDTTDNATFEQALRILLKFEQYSASTATAARYPITALGVSVDVPKVFDWYRERLKTIYLPHLIVAVSHFSYRDADRPDCQIMPPTISRFPNHVKLLYGHTLVNDFYVACTRPGQHQSVAQLIKLVSNKLRTSGTVSVTLKGRWYQPKYADPSNPDIGNFSYYVNCTAFQGDQDVAPASVCQTSTAAIKSNYKYDSGPQAGISFDKQLRRTLTLETEESLREKLCDLKRALVGIEFSIAVYDVDFDAGGPACSSLTISGPYRRLQMIHNLRNFFRDRYRHFTHHPQCLNVTV